VVLIRVSFKKLSEFYFELRFLIRLNKELGHDAKHFASNARYAFFAHAGVVSCPRIARGNQPQA
jgi:hypothetical protein